MKNRNSIFHCILFGILMLSLFSFMAQEHLKLFKTKPLTGYFLEHDRPIFRWECFKNGHYQRDVENYISNKFGFREPIIRLYHQFSWDLFSKEYVDYIYSGKNRWLFYDHNVEDYYGTEMYQWYNNAEAAQKGYEQEVRLLNKVKGILAEYDVTLLTFIAPSKDVVYPEYLPPRDFDTTTLNPRIYFTKRFEETGMPCFDMNSYFMKMKDTCSFYLFPPTGDHWNFSCVYATDSLMRFMGALRGIQLPRVVYGNNYSDSCRIGEDKNRDLEGDLNLLRPIKFDQRFAYKERDFWLDSDSATIKPAALFVGNSFLLQSIAYLPPKNVFSDFQFWYYNKVAYQGVDQLIDSVSNLNRLDYLLDADYVVFFSSASQMYRATEGFAEDAIIQLCIGEERFKQRQQQLMDSLAIGEKAAFNLLRKDPEAYFPEIAGEDIPSVRNPILLTDAFWKKREFRKRIKRDPQWMLGIMNQMVKKSLSLQQSIDLEVEQAFQGQPLLRDKCLSAQEYREILIKQVEQQIWSDSDWLAMVKEKAVEQGFSIDECVYNNAAYMVDQKIQSGEIILPQTPETRETLIKKTEQEIRGDKQWLEMIEKQADEQGILLEENIYQHAAYMVDQKILEGEIILSKTE